MGNLRLSIPVKQIWKSIDSLKLLTNDVLKCLRNTSTKLLQKVKSDPLPKSGKLSLNVVPFSQGFEFRLDLC